MAKSIRDIKKKVGRPKTTGSGAAQLVRMHDAQLTAIDTWRQKHDVRSRPEAIRRLVELGLTIKTKAKQSSPALGRSAPKKKPTKRKRRHPHVTLDGVEISGQEAIALLRADLGLRPDGTDPEEDGWVPGLKAKGK
jgi:hypothetical protein